MIPNLRDIYNEIKVNIPGRISLKRDESNERYFDDNKNNISYYQTHSNKINNVLEVDTISGETLESDINKIKRILKSLNIPFEIENRKEEFIVIKNADKYFNFPLNEIKVHKPFQYKKAYGESHSYDEYIQNRKLTGEQADNFLVDIENKKILASFTGWNVARWASEEDKKHNQYYKASLSTIKNPPPYMTIPKLDPDDPNSWSSGAITIINRNKELYNEIKVHKPGRIKLIANPNPGYEGYLFDMDNKITYFQDENMFRNDEIDTDYINTNLDPGQFKKWKDILIKLNIPFEYINAYVGGGYFVINNASKYFNIPSPINEIKVHKPGLTFPMDINDVNEAKRIAIVLNKLGYTWLGVYNKEIKWGDYPFVNHNTTFNSFQLFFHDEKDQKNKKLDYQYYLNNID